MYLYSDSITIIPFLTLSTIIFISVISPTDLELQPEWGKKIGSWCMHTALRYFGLRLYYEDQKAIENCGPGIFILEPHDVLPISLFTMSHYLDLVKGHKCVGCVTGICFKLPLMKHVYSWVSATSVDGANVRKLMDTGHSPTICPGGVQEVILIGQSPPGKKECILFLKQRKGVVKLAMQYGRPLIPTFTFGLRKTWDFWIPKSDFAKWLGRKIGFVPMVFFGLFGIPFNISKPCSLTMVIGKPIHVPKFEPDKDGKFSPEDIDKYHTKMLDAMKQIYNDYKDEFEMADTTLKIV